MKCYHIYIILAFGNLAYHSTGDIVEVTVTKIRLAKIRISTKIEEADQF